MTEAIPHDVLVAIGVAGGVVVGPVVARRGVHAARVDCNGRRYRVEWAAPTADGISADAASVQRSAAALVALPGYESQCDPLVVECADGRVLRRNWLDGAAPDLATPEGLRGAIDALAAVHLTGFVHGDVQPVHFLEEPGGVVMLDFGLAHRTDEPMAGYRGGLVHLNAPELCAAILMYGAGVATPATDVYALGASAYVTVTGRYPVALPSNATYDTILQSIATAAPDASELAAHPVGPVIAACLAPVGERPTDADALRARLDR